MSQLADALARWERAWEALGAPVASVLRPGTEPDRVHQLLGPSLGSVPEPLVEWFTWHDGADSSWSAAPTGTEFLSVDLALANRGVNMSLPTHSGMGDEMPTWQSTWLPLLGGANGSFLAFDADTEKVRLVDYWDAEFARIAAPDLLTAVTFWCELLEAGHFAWSDAGWTCQYLDLPLSARTSNLL
jgi:hypothetical protein